MNLSRNRTANTFFASLLGTLFVLLGTVQLATAQVAFITPSPNAQTELQEALILAQPGDTILLSAGVFLMTDSLSLTTDEIEIRGAGMYQTILQFGNQQRGSEGLLVTGDGVIIEGLAIEDTKGDAVKVQGCEGITFRNVRAEWTRGPHSENGAYGFYPVQCKDVLVEDSLVRGASDAGIYVGQSERIIVRNNRVEENVAGIEIENSYYADVYENVAVNNTAGILVFDLPDLPLQGGHHTRVFNNSVYENNTPNFAAEGNIVAGVPSGTGIIVMAFRDVEIFNNEIKDHSSANIIVSSYALETDDPNYNRLPDRIQIHGNVLGAYGYSPDWEKLGEDVFEAAGGRSASIIWDGVGDLSDTLGITNRRSRVIIGANQDNDFLDLDMVWYYLFSPLHNPQRNHEKYSANIEPLAPVTLQ